MAKVGRPTYLFAVPYHAGKDPGKVRPGLKIHELKTDIRAVCGNSRRQPMDDRPRNRDLRIPVPGYRPPDG